jgi:hypothetical protein
MLRPKIKKLCVVKTYNDIEEVVVVIIKSGCWDN